MRIQKIEPSPITAADIDAYQKAIVLLKGNLITATDVGMNKRIITVRSKPQEPIHELTLVNPVVVETKEPFAFVERDTVKPKKSRKTIRFKEITVETDNLGKLVLTADDKPIKTLEDFYSNDGLMACVCVQRLIDAINGIDVTSPIRKYDSTVKAGHSYGRNDNVMLENEDGETVFIKYKRITPYLELGYKLI